MLDCKRNRLDYGQLLCPPDGFRFDRAVATTYSADLDTLLSIPIALVYAQTLEGDLSGSRPQLLQAIKRFSQQVKIYHQKGQLHVPAKLNWLHVCLEDALVAVMPDDPFAAFHPKLWVIRYTPADDESDAGPRYRVIVLSRNLTFERSWDVAASLDGSIGKKIQKSNRPLIDFVHWLDRQSPIPQLEEMVAELARVEFTIPYPFEAISFHPMGVDGYTEHAMTNRKSRDTLVIAPFLHQAFLDRLRTNTDRQFSLFSEDRELEKLPIKLLSRMENYCLSGQIIDGEGDSNAEEGGATDIKKQNLHAKLFLFETKEETSWFLGSANATRAAAEKNVEFMLELRGKAQSVRIRPRIKELTGGEGAAGPFLPFAPEAGGKDDAEERKQQEQIRRFEFALLNANIHGKVQAAENGKNFDLHLTLELERVLPQPGLSLTVKPFNTGGGFKPQRLQVGRRETCEFANIAEVDLSRFVHFRIETSDGEAQHEFLLRIDIDGLPQDRVDNILRKIINSSDKFFDYLRFMLADEINKEDLLGSSSPDVSTHSAADVGEGWHFHLPIYEQLLVTASRSPRKLAEVDEIIGHLTKGNPETVIPEAFLAFWEAFRSLIPTSQPKKL